PVWVTLTGRDAVSGVKSIKYRVDGGNWRDYQGAFKIDDNVAHTVKYYATDHAGNRETERTWAVSIDRSAPLTLSQPQINESMWYTQPLTVELDSTDATTGVVATHYRVNGGPFVPYTGPFTINAQGVNLMDYFAEDAAGNRESLRRVDVRMDSVNPTLEVTAPLESYLYLMGRPLLPLDRFAIIIGGIQVTARAEDATSGIQRVEFSTDGTLRHTDTQAPYSWLWDEPALGPYTIQVKAYDRAGNTARVEVPAMVFNL
ncbi:MAG: Ig-like domain-containing protein, partial [Candidatus Thermoplasmatota archaeon]|nr:Ig-like domain-containing protein [Candidatus Thermoplasmatota archaeon]